MAKLRDILGSMGEGEGTDEHPKLGVWRQQDAKAKEGGHEVRVKLYRPPDLLGYKSAKLYLEVTDKKGIVVWSDQDDWDASLDQGLLNLGIRSVSPENEGERFNLLLEAAFTQFEDRYGDAAFNAVFVDYLKEITDSARLQEMLAYSTALSPNKDLPAYAGCREGIANSIRNRARELHLKLHYSVDETDNILTSALLRNLDERFSVTNRKRMGLL